MRILDTYKNGATEELRTSIAPNVSQLDYVIMNTTSNVPNIPVWKNTSLKDLPGEIWKPLKGFERYYLISNIGRVKSLHKEYKTFVSTIISVPTFIKKPSFSEKGYLQISLNIDGNHITRKVHRLVAKTFVDNPLGLREVNHIDENKTNNFVDNLEWTTRRKNCNHGTRNQKISAYHSKPLMQITLDGEIVRKWASRAETEKGGFNPRRVSDCVLNVRKTHAGYKWVEYMPHFELIKP